MDEEMRPLSEILQILRDRGITTLHRTNLAAKTLVNDKGAAESFLDQLARKELAETRQHGKRRRWYVSPAALPNLVDLARGGRPGPAPGAQVTLDAVQCLDLIRHLAAATDPLKALRGALAAATGLDDETIARVERIVIPLDPRQRPGE